MHRVHQKNKRPERAFELIALSGHRPSSRLRQTTAGEGRRFDGISGRSERLPEQHVRTANHLRLSNKSYALQRPMAKLVLLQQLGISVPEIYSSKNLEHTLVTSSSSAPCTRPKLEPSQCSAETTLRSECKTHLTPVSPIVTTLLLSPCVAPACLWTKSPSLRCLLASSC